MIKVLRSPATFHQAWKTQAGKLERHPRKICPMIMTPQKCHPQSFHLRPIRASKSANPNGQWTMEVAAMEAV